MMSLCRLNMGLEVLQSKERRRCGTLTTSFPSTLQAPKTSSPWKPDQSADQLQVQEAPVGSHLLSSCCMKLSERAPLYMTASCP